MALTKEEQALESSNTKSAFELAKQRYEAGDTNATWVDPINGLLRYADYVSKTAPRGTGDMYQRVQERYTAPQMSVQGGQTQSPQTPKTADQIAFESLYPGKTYTPPAGAAPNVPAVPAPTTSADKSATRTATNTVKGYDTNNNWAEVWVPAGKYVPGVSAYPNKTTPSSMEKATSSPDLSKTMGETQTTSEADSMFAGAATSMAELIKSITPAQTDTEKRQQQILDKMISSAEGTKDLLAEQLTTEQSAGLPGMRAQFADINAQILTKLAEGKALDASYEKANLEVEGKSITLSRKQGQEALNYKMYLAQKNALAADVGILQAQALGLQGKITDAQNTVNRAIDLKFKIQEADNAVYQAQLNAIIPLLNKEEKTQALAQQIILDQKKQALADKKDSEKEIYGLMLKAVDLGIRDASILSQIGNSKSLSEATVILGKNAPPADSKAPQIETWGGRVHQWNPVTAKWEDIGSEKSIGGDNSQTVIDWANQVANGTRKFSDVPEELKSSVNSAISKLPPKQEDVKQTQSKIDELNSIINHPGLNSSVGPNAASRTAFTDAFGNKSDFIAKVQRLLSEKTLQSLIDAKANGATFGALSEGELKLLQQAASNIGTWAVKDDEGNIIGYNVSEKAFKEEINRIKGDYENLLKETAGQQTNTFNITQKIDDYYLKNPDKRAFIDTLDAEKNPATGQEYTEEEKAKILGISFNQVDGDTNIAVKVASVTPTGSTGGQCGIYSRKLVDFPSGMGNSLQEKKAFVSKVGIPANEWRKNVKVGDVIFTTESPTYGHVAVVNAILPDGRVQLSESNYNLDEKVNNTRTLYINSPVIYGAVRGTLKV